MRNRRQRETCGLCDLLQALQIFLEHRALIFLTTENATLTSRACAVPTPESATPAYCLQTQTSENGAAAGRKASTNGKTAVVYERVNWLVWHGTRSRIMEHTQRTLLQQEDSTSLVMLFSNRRPGERMFSFERVCLTDFIWFSTIQTLKSFTSSEAPTTDFSTLTQKRGN